MAQKRSSSFYVLLLIIGVSCTLILIYQYMSVGYESLPSDRPQAHTIYDYENLDIHGINISNLSVGIQQFFRPKQWNFVYFQHIRKSGGTSFNQLLINNDLCAWVGKFHNNSLCMTPQNFAIGDIYSHKRYMRKKGGHAISIEYSGFFVSNYNKYHNTDWKDVLLVTLIRDPITRIFSDLFHRIIWSKPCKLKYNARHFRHPGTKNFNLSDGILIDCLTMNDNKRMWTENFYVKTFSEQRVWKGQTAKRDNPMTEKHLEIAMKTIQHFDAVLILESWDDHEVQLQCNGFNNVTLPHENKAFWKTKLHMILNEHPLIRKTIENINELDMRFYEFAIGVARNKTQQCLDYLAVTKP